MLKKIAKPMSMILAISFLLFNLAIQAAKAEMIGTETAVHLAGKEQSRAIVTAFLERDDVRQTMAQQGVDVAEARKRVAALSDAELQQIAQKVDQLPAGGDGVGAVLGAILLVFFVLLITDLLGLTHVFPFVTRR